MILQITGTKGGVGKTTLATNLSVLFDDVIVIDTDKESIFSYWSELRRSKNENVHHIPVFQKFGGGIGQEILELNNRYKNIIIDNAGADEKELKATMCVSDIVIFPLKPTQFDSWTVSKIESMFQISKTINPKLKGFFVISQNSTNVNIKEANESVQILKEVEGIKVLNTVIHTRLSYMKAAKLGLSVVELDDIKARDEIVNLYNEINKELGNAN